VAAGEDIAAASVLGVKMEVDSLDKIECRADGMLLPAWAAPSDAGAGVGSAGDGGGCPSLPLVWLQVWRLP
jgi:hypothetical protein